MDGAGLCGLNVTGNISARRSMNQQLDATGSLEEKNDHGVIAVCLYPTRDPRSPLPCLSRRDHRRALRGLSCRFATQSRDSNRI